MTKFFVAASVMLLTGCGSSTLAAPITRVSEPNITSISRGRPTNSCGNTGGLQVGISPKRGHIKANFRHESTRGFVVVFELPYGSNDNTGEAIIDISASTCNYFDAPQPSGGTVDLYVASDGVCSGSCPGKITFTHKTKSMAFITDNRLEPSGTYLVYFWANGSGVPQAVLPAQVVTRNGTPSVAFASPFQPPFEYNPSDKLFFEIVQE